MFFFLLQYLQQFHCLVLIYQHRTPFVKATDQQPPLHLPHPPPLPSLPSPSLFHGINIVIIFIFYFCRFKLRYSNSILLKD